jgi:hypothetical protein
MRAVITKYLDDVSLSLGKSLEDSVKRAVEESLKNIGDHYT